MFLTPNAEKFTRLKEKNCNQSFLNILIVVIAMILAWLLPILNFENVQVRLIGLKIALLTC